MALIRGREQKTAAKIFTASMADIVFLLIVFFVITYKVEVDRTQMDLPDTWIRIKVPEKAAVISTPGGSPTSKLKIFARVSWLVYISTLVQIQMCLPVISEWAPGKSGICSAITNALKMFLKVC